MTPSRFKEELKRFDKRLDFVWNGRKQRYEIIGESARHQKYLIASFGIGKIETLGLQYIRDMAEVSPLKSSAKEINQRIDNIIEAQEKDEEKHQANNINDHLDEAWEHFQYAEGSRVSLATIGMKEEIQIRDRRRFIDDSKRTMAADPKDARISVNAKTAIEPIDKRW